MFDWFVEWLPSEYLAIPEVQLVLALAITFVGAFSALYIFDTLLSGFRKLLERRK